MHKNWRSSKTGKCRNRSSSKKPSQFKSSRNRNNSKINSKSKSKGSRYRTFSSSPCRTTPSTTGCCCLRNPACSRTCSSSRRSSRRASRGTRLGRSSIRPWLRSTKKSKKTQCGWPSSTSRPCSARRKSCRSWPRRAPRGEQESHFLCASSKCCERRRSGLCSLR